MARKSFSKKYARVGYRENLHNKLVVALITRFICQTLVYTQIQINKIGSFEETSRSSESSGHPTIISHVKLMGVSVFHVDLNTLRIDEIWALSSFINFREM